MKRETFLARLESAAYLIIFLASLAACAYAIKTFFFTAYL